MGLVKRGGKFLKKDGKLVTNEDCCCNCFEYCIDTEISVTLPAFTTAAGCDNCEDVDAGPWVLTKYTPAEPVAGCCYWKNEVGGGTGECAVVSIFAEVCITGDGPEQTVTLTITVNSAGGVIHTFTQEYTKLEFCELIPGAVDVAADSGECDTEGVASILFAGGCCFTEKCCSGVLCGEEVNVKIEFLGPGTCDALFDEENIVATLQCGVIEGVEYEKYLAFEIEVTNPNCAPGEFGVCTWKLNVVLTIQWDGEKCVSGMVYYLLRTDDFNTDAIHATNTPVSGQPVEFSAELRTDESTSPFMSATLTCTPLEWESQATFSASFDSGLSELCDPDLADCVDGMLRITVTP